MTFSARDRHKADAADRDAAVKSSRIETPARRLPRCWTPSRYAYMTMELRQLSFALLTAASVGCSHSSTDVRNPSPAETSARRSSVDEKLLPVSGTIFIGCGFLVVENHAPTNFTVLIAGKDVRQAAKDKAVFIVDGVLVETTATTAADVGIPSARGAALLRSHMEWEATYSAKAHGWPTPHTDSDPVGLGIPGVDGLIWGYDFPAPVQVLGQNVVRIAYLTAAVDNVVFAAAAPGRPGDDFHAVYRVLGRIVRSIRREAKSIDLLELSSELKATKKPWKGCLESAR